MDLFFSFATIYDAPELVKLVNSAYRGDVSKKGWTTEADLLDGQRTDYEEILNLIEKPNSSILVARTQQKEIIACCEIRIIDANYFYPTNETHKNLYFGMFSVNPNLQNQGIGKLFLNKIEEYGKKWNSKMIQMTVITLRSELLSYYQRRGFIITKHIVPFPSETKFGIAKVSGLEMVVLEKPI